MMSKADICGKMVLKGMGDRTERFKAAIARNPERWIPEYCDEELVTVIDRDSGLLWFRVNDGWAWIA